VRLQGGLTMDSKPRPGACSCDCVPCCGGHHLRCRAGGCSLSTGAGLPVEGRPGWETLARVVSGDGATEVLVTLHEDGWNVGIEVRHRASGKCLGSVLVDRAAAQGFAYALAGKLEVKL
jgi:hypothetical protein